MARYQLGDRFWDVEVEACELTVRHGKVGHLGRELVKTFHSRDQAQTERDKLVRAKRKQGYEPAAAPVVAPADDSLVGRDVRNLDLEAAIVADPDDDQAYLVYADWLQQQSDPRGALITLQHAAARAPTDRALAIAAEDYLAAHAAYLLGPLAAHTRPHDGREERALTWRNGFLDRARLSVRDGTRHGGQPYRQRYQGSLADLIDVVLRHPSARFLAELRLGLNGETYNREASLGPAIARLAALAPPSLRRLHIADFEYSGETEISWYQLGDLAPLWPRLPGLRELTVQGAYVELGEIDLPALRRARFHSGGLLGEALRSIAAARWPLIEDLEIWCGSIEYGGTVTADDAGPLLARTDLPHLRRLGLMNSEITDELVELLPDAALLPQLRTLDLSMGTMSDAGASILARHADRFRHLEVLEVSSNYLSDEAVAALAGVARQVVSVYQRSEWEDHPGRFVSVGE